MTFSTIILKIAVLSLTWTQLHGERSPKRSDNNLRFKPHSTNSVSPPYPFRNESLPWSQRLDDLMDRLTVDEMLAQMAGGGGTPQEPAPSIPRLAIPPYQFDTECLHGIMNMPATAFPQSVGLAASFSESMIYSVAEAIGTEARAYYNDFSSRGDYSDFHSTSCFAPFNNVQHHPLWGRLQEVYGEDPFLSGSMASAYVKGMQGPHPKYMRAIAGCKVILVHSGPEDFPVSRMVFDAKVNESDIRLTYLPTFKMCIEAGSLNLMCSYNSINGVPACASSKLMLDLVRGELNFTGFIVSDQDAVFNIYAGHKYAATLQEAAVMAVNAGVDLELHGSQGNRAFLLLNDAVRKKLVSEATVKKRARNLFYARMRLGLFDLPQSSPYSSIKLDVIQSEAHRRLATQAAAMSFVLLRNDLNVLPLKKGTFDKLAIIGPMANNTVQIIGNYAPVIVPKFTSTPYDGLRSAASNVSLASACSDTLCNDYNATVAIQAAVDADFVILCVGTGWTLENEGTDRRTMDLPLKQQQLITDVITYASSPVVVLVFSGGPVNLQPLKHAKVAIVQCFFPGETTGEALKQVLFDSDVSPAISPAARLPYTWPMNDAQLPDITHYGKPSATYRYWTQAQAAPLYSFGYGLSYSRFLYLAVNVSPNVVKKNDVIKVDISVQNIGNYDADEVIQVYVSWRGVSSVMPQRQLVAFKRSSISKSSKLSETLTFKASQLMVWDETKGLFFNSGIVDLYVGGQQPFQESKVPSNVLHSTLTILN